MPVIPAHSLDCMNAGNLRDELTFYKLERSGDGRGGTNGDYVIAFALAGDVTPMKPITTIEGGKMTIIQPYKVIVRYEEEFEVKPDMKVQWDGRDYLIRNIQEQDTRRMVVSFMITKAG